jgi:hypothetical protein
MFSFIPERREILYGPGGIFGPRGPFRQGHEDHENSDRLCCVKFFSLKFSRF